MALLTSEPSHLAFEPLDVLSIHPLKGPGAIANKEIDFCNSTYFLR
jgi:hypothetical protein